MHNNLTEVGIVDRGEEYLYSYFVSPGHYKLEELLATFEKVPEKLEQTMLTTAQQIRKECRQARNLEIAKNMLRADMPKEQVSKFTGLGPRQIEQLLKEVS